MYAAKTQSGVGGDAALAVDDVRDAPGWHAEVQGEPIGAQLSSGHFATQDTSRMYGERHI